MSILPIMIIVLKNNFATLTKFAWVIKKVIICAPTNLLSPPFSMAPSYPVSEHCLIKLKSIKYVYNSKSSRFPFQKKKKNSSYIRILFNTGPVGLRVVVEALGVHVPNTHTTFHTHKAGIPINTHKAGIHIDNYKAGIPINTH